MHEKRHRLEAILSDLGPATIAVSGGVDSMTLAVVAHRVNPRNVAAVHAISPAVPPEATERVKDWAAREGWNPGLADAACFATVDPQGFLIGELDGEPAATISCVNYDEAFAFLGVYIVREDGKPFKIRHALVRHIIGYPLSMAIFFLGFLWMLWDSRQQGWHDKLAHTIVVMSK